MGASVTESMEHHNYNTTAERINNSGIDNNIRVVRIGSPSPPPPSSSSRGSSPPSFANHSNARLVSSHHAAFSPTASRIVQQRSMPGGQTTASQSSSTAASNGGNKTRVPNGRQQQTSATAASGQRLLVLNSAIRHANDRSPGFYYAQPSHQSPGMLGRSASATLPPTTSLTRGIRGRPTYMPAGMRSMGGVHQSPLLISPPPMGGQQSELAAGGIARRLPPPSPSSPASVTAWGDYRVPTLPPPQRTTLTVRSQKVVQQTNAINGKLQQQEQAAQLVVPRSAAGRCPSSSVTPLAAKMPAGHRGGGGGGGRRPSGSTAALCSPSMGGFGSPSAMRIPQSPRPGQIPRSPSLEMAGLQNPPRLPPSPAASGVVVNRPQPAGRRLSYDNVPATRPDAIVDAAKQPPLRSPAPKRPRKPPASRKKSAPSATAAVPVPVVASGGPSTLLPPLNFVPQATSAQSSTRPAISSASVAVKLAKTPPVPRVTAQELVAAQQPPGPETIAERHARLLRTASDLCDRVRASERVQWRRLCREEIAALLAHCRKESGELSERGDKAEENARSDEKAIARRKHQELERRIDELLKSKTFRFKEEQLRRKTPAELARLIRRFELRGGLLDTVSPGAASFVLDSGARPPLTLSEETLDRILIGSRRMLTLQRLIESRRDPYATDSSSDSDEDEMETLGLLEQPSTSKRAEHKKGVVQHNPVSKSSATWKWYNERAQIISRYEFLMMRIEDVDYKIRQQVDILSQLMSLKEPFRFSGDSSSTADERREGTSDAHMQEESEEHGGGESAARIRPVIAPWPKRPMMRTAGTFKWNHAMGERSLCPCGCAPPFSPCLLCTGRMNNTREPGDTSLDTALRRYAIVEPAIHPELSMHSAISYERRVETYLRRLSTLPRTMVPKRRTSSPECRGAIIGRLEQPQQQQRPSQNHHRRTTTTASAAIGPRPSHKKKKPEELKRRKGPVTKTMKESARATAVKRKRKVSKSEEEDYCNSEEVMEEDDEDWMVRTGKSTRRIESSDSESGGGGRRSRPLKLRLAMGKRLIRQSAQRLARGRVYSDAAAEKVGGARRRHSTAGKLAGTRRATTAGQATYDFDNIVIDPSVLAVREIEKLEYKEIAVPGWRIVPVQPLSPAPVAPSDSGNCALQQTRDESIAIDLEQIDESTVSQAYAARHQRYEERERTSFKEYKDLRAAQRTPLVHVPLSPLPTPSSATHSSSVFDSPTKGGTTIPDYDRPSVVRPYPPRKFDLTRRPSANSDVV